MAGKFNISKAQLPKILSNDPAVPEGCIIGDIIKLRLARSVCVWDLLSNGKKVVFVFSIAFFTSSSYKDKSAAV